MVSRPQAPRRLKRRWWTYTLATGIALVTALAVYQAYDYRVRLLAPWRGFAPAREFPLTDSLPALSGGLSDLEAFRLRVFSDSAEPVRTDVEQSLWIADSVRDIRMEYFTDKIHLDSVSLFLWTDASGTTARTFRGRREIRWDVPVRRRVADWMEAVAFYVSHPRVLNFRAQEDSIELFAQVEGKTVHVVRGRYRDRKNPITPPDTAYPAPVLPEESASAEFRMMARGAALAIVNPLPYAMTVRILGVRENHAHLCRVEAHTVHVYRHLLRDVRGPVVAYTAPDETFALFPRKDATPPSYYWWRGPDPRRVGE